MTQEGLFTTSQAAAAGYSSQLLGHHARAGNMTRLRRGLYRIVHCPPNAHEDLVAAWLWSEREGVLSHQSALALHELSDVLPARIHLTVPSAWQRRRFRLPPGTVLHHADVPPEDRSWSGVVPTTSPRRTLNDCARDGLAPDLLRQATTQALRRGLIDTNRLDGDVAALALFGGIAP